MSDDERYRVLVTIPKRQRALRAQAILNRHSIPLKVETTSSGLTQLWVDAERYDEAKQVATSENITGLHDLNTISSRKPRPIVVALLALLALVGGWLLGDLLQNGTALFTWEILGNF